MSSAIVPAAAKGILLKVKKNILPEYGGQATLTKAWVQSLLNCMGFVKRRGTTKCSISAENFESLREEYLNNISTTVIMEDIPPEMVLNWDQTGLRIIPSKSWTMEKRGSHRVELKGIDDKRQITATLCGTSTGVFLPPQIIYQGKTNRCHPTIKFPADWCITHSPNHWANEHTTLDYLNHVILPYFRATCCESKLSEDHPGLVIFDKFKAHLTEKVTKLLEDNIIHFVIVPANCTDCLQPLDLSVNKSVKDFLRQKFEAWYADQILSQLENGESEDTIKPVSLAWSSIKKNTTAIWLIEMFDYIQDNPQFIINGFLKAGIPQAIDEVVSATRGE